MKRFVFFIAAFYVLFSVLDLRAQKLIPNHLVSGVCYAGNKIKKIYIPPPDEFFKKSVSKGGGSITIYYTGFSSQTKKAVEYAKSIWETMLPADTRLTIYASWENISIPGVLASSTITDYKKGSVIDALNPNELYPIALAEKIARKSLNEDSEPDIELRINSSVDWYYGTDGKTPTNKYDLVTVALHEICHGLGFYDSFYTDGEIGSYELPPLIYDTFVETNAGDKLIDTLKFKNNSVALGSQLIENQLYFNGPLLKRYCVLHNLPFSRAQLYAPATWDASSICHLDESKTPEVNSLMTPFIDYAEAIHDPGKFTMSILGDLGWINTRIIHEPTSDTETHLTEILLSAEIKSDTLFNHDKVGVVFSFDKFRTSDTLFLNSQNSDDLFSTIVEIPFYNSELQYYFFVEDCFFRLYESPSLAKEKPYSVYIGTDTVKPVISHIPKEYYFEKIDSIPFDATVTDNIGIDTVYIEYRVNDGSVKYFGLPALGHDKFGRNFNVRTESLKGGDALNYRIFAIDKAACRNTRILPSSGYFTTKIEGLGSVLLNYSTDFTNARNDFINSGFEIAKPSGFNSYALHSEHPYKSPDEAGKSLNFISALRYPIIFKASGMIISFRELVLVEPGEEGSVFGSWNFYDYVILEGSKDFGKSWFNLCDGYNSRINSSWESAYISSLNDSLSSTYIGKESMMLTHYIYPRIANKVSDGDSLLIRFRLYSDPYAHGWGWVIDDLKIDPLVDNAGELKINNLNVFPNPGHGLINIDIDNLNSLNPVEISVFDAFGKGIIKNQFYPDKVVKLDISRNPSGLYIVVIKGEHWIKSVKYVLIK